tara:strand:- start:226 stop:636 length:411 start_codon:yes stop_codon:yes gene_type:complete
MKMFFGNKNLIKSLLIVILTSSLPINNAKANIRNRFSGNQFLGKWCITKGVVMGETKILKKGKDRQKCFILKQGGELIELDQWVGGSYELLDDEKIVIFPLKPVLKSKNYELEYDKNTEEFKLILDEDTELYYKKQ